MGTIRRIERGASPNGEMKLVKVLFTPQVPNPAKQFDVEAVYQVELLDGVLDDDKVVISPLSCTRTDTREPYVMSESQRKAVILAAAEAAAEKGVGD